MRKKWKRDRKTDTGKLSEQPVSEPAKGGWWLLPVAGHPEEELPQETAQNKAISLMSLLWDAFSDPPLLFGPQSKCGRARPCCLQNSK